MTCRLVVVDGLGHRPAQREAGVTFSLVTVGNLGFAVRVVAATILALGTLRTAAVFCRLGAAAHQDTCSTEHWRSHEGPRDSQDEQHLPHHVNSTFRVAAPQVLLARIERLSGRIWSIESDLDPVCSSAKPAVDRRYDEERQ